VNYISQNLRFDSKKQQWGVMINMRGMNVFHPCHIEPVIPSSISKKIRNCFGNYTVVDCPKDYTDNKVIELCHSYTALVFEPERTFRNVHCAICNDAAPDFLSCHTFEIFARLNWQTTFDTFSFAVLFDIGGDANAAVGQAKVTCGEGQLYDPFFKKCRNVVCGSEKKMNERGICSDTQISVKQTAKPTFTSNTTASPSATMSSISKMSTPSGSTALAIQSVTTNFTSPTTSISQLTSSVASTAQKNGSTTIVSASIFATSTITITTATTGTVLSLSTTGTPTSSTPVTTTESFVEEITLTPFEIETIFVNLTELAAAHIPNTTNHTKASYKLEPEQEGFAYCPKFELAVEEFHIIDENSVYIEQYDKTLISDQFELVNNSLVFCASLAQGTNQIGKFGKDLSYVTIAFISVSVLCLTLHLIVTLLSPGVDFTNNLRAAFP
jgi:hypothetical protein